MCFEISNGNLSWRRGPQSQWRKTPLTQGMADTARHGQGPASLAQSLAWYTLETHGHRRKPWTRWKGGGQD